MITLRVIFLGSEKRPFRYRKAGNNLANLARGYHRPGGAGFAKENAAKAFAVENRLLRFPKCRRSTWRLFRFVKEGLVPTDLPCSTP